jgi:S-adenosylmethionine/arginine decarboxylase-like enzyme
MRNIEPEIHRQRLIIEARYGIKVGRETVREYLLDLIRIMGMTIHPQQPEPIITSATGKSKPLHDGYEGFCFWLESGVSIYIWERYNFLSIDMYSCKKFEKEVALEHAKKFFQISDLEFQETVFN